MARPKDSGTGFGVAAVSAGIPLNLVQKWLGHAQLTAKAIYADAVGAQEKDIAGECGANILIMTTNLFHAGMLGGQLVPDRVHGDVSFI